MSIHEFKNLEKTIENYLKKMHTKGHMLLIDINKDFIKNDNFSKLLEIARFDENIQGADYFSDRDLEKILGNFGFKNLKKRFSEINPAYSVFLYSS